MKQMEYLLCQFYTLDQQKVHLKVKYIFMHIINFIDLFPPKLVQKGSALARGKRSLHSKMVVQSCVTPPYIYTSFKYRSLHDCTYYSCSYDFWGCASLHYPLKFFRVYTIMYILAKGICSHNYSHYSPLHLHSSTYYSSQFESLQ